MSLIRIENLSKVYNDGQTGVNALSGLNLTIEERDFVAIMGTSGSGKSTLLTMLGGLNKPSEGSIVIDDIELYSLDKRGLADYRREYVGFVFQSFQLIPYLTARENILLPLVNSTLSLREKNGKVLEILERVGLEGKESRLAEQLSGGEQQRVSIARALINDPLLILADEPTGNLDTKTGSEIIGLFKDLNNEGKTVIIVTHDPAIKNRSLRTVNLCDGQLVA